VDRLEDYSARGQSLSIADGDLIFAPGDESRAFLIVTAGTVRVEQTNPAGRTVVLYRVRAGESCVLTTTCLVSDRPYPGFGYAEGPVDAIAIAAKDFKRLLAEDRSFQRLVFAGFALRVRELTDVIDDLLEHRTDLRLARWLSEWPSENIAKTQADLAQELGTAREVVSRALKAFERHGWVHLGRGRITICDRAALRDHGAGGDV